MGTIDILSSSRYQTQQGEVVEDDSYCILELLISVMILVSSERWKNGETLFCIIFATLPCSRVIKEVHLFTWQQSILVPLEKLSHPLFSAAPSRMTKKSFGNKNHKVFESCGRIVNCCPCLWIPQDLTGSLSVASNSWLWPCGVHCRLVALISAVRPCRHPTVHWKQVGRAET